MIINIPEDHIKRYIKEYGYGIDQLDILQEECSELIKAISKYKRGRHTEDIELRSKARQSIIEELTHVAISSEVVCIAMYIDPGDILKEVNKKALSFKED